VRIFAPRALNAHLSRLKIRQAEIISGNQAVTDFRNLCGRNARIKSLDAKEQRGAPTSF